MLPVVNLCMAKSGRAADSTCLLHECVHIRAFFSMASGKGMDLRAGDLGNNRSLRDGLRASAGVLGQYPMS